MGFKCTKCGELEHACTCVMPHPLVSASGSNALLSAVELTRMQEKKLRYLIDKGGKHSAITVFVQMPDGTTAAIDPFGRTTWQGG